MKKVKLGEVATFINGYAFKPQDWSSEGKEIIRIQNLTKTSKEINYYSGTIDKKYIVEDGDILISWSGTLGVFQWCGKSAVLNQHIFKVVFDKMDIDKSYFKYVVEKGLQDAIKHTHGSTMKHLTKKYFDNIMVSYTNLREQQRIASELDLLSKLILRRQEQLEEFNILVKSRFNEMFGDPVLNEMGWEKHRLSKLTLKIGSGATPRGGRESYVNEGIALIRSMNVYDGKFMFKDLAYLTNIQAEKLNNVIVESDDVLLNITGASVSRCCIVPQNILPARVNQHVSIIRCKKHLLSPIFLNQLLITSEFKSLLLKIGESSGATRQAITKNQIEELYVPLPPLSLQNEFADFVAQVDKSQLAIQKSLEELETLKKSLMQEYFG
ncbi:restriction endonuclease subunit S [Streptococcus oralis]|nr:restriction endonuclease subunit S [Streptococcus oralis]MCY7092345.1 restriction endonuclease subunit S [Streptococcus oralis]ORO36401.1 restriction endonuclease subunit S [Streptococcus oralis subsp. tigurinus]